MPVAFDDRVVNAADHRTGAAPTQPGHVDQKPHATPSNWRICRKVKERKNEPGVKWDVKLPSSHDADTSAKVCDSFIYATFFFRQNEW
jgi:hypothetical protein